MTLDSRINPLSGLGQVTLVGAGPGDPELLTIKALKAIEHATLLLVDDLVSEAIVQFAKPVSYTHLTLPTKRIV